MVGLPVAVFLHNRFSFLFFSPPIRLSTSLFCNASLFWPAPGKVSPRVKLLSPLLQRRAAYISLTLLTYTHPARAVPRSTRGGLYLNNIHELRYTRQIYCPGTRGFCKDSETNPCPLTVTPCVFPFLRTTILCVLSVSVLRFSRFQDHPWYTHCVRAINH